MSNGELRVSHEDFHAFGVTRKLIATAIRECEAAGVVRVRRRGKIAGLNAPNLYRITWMGGWGAEGQMIHPSNEWKSATAASVERVRKTSRAKKRRAPPANVVHLPGRK